MPGGADYGNLSKTAEVGRLSAYCVKAFVRRESAEDKYDSADLRDDLIREMKKTRGIIAKAEEASWGPAPLRKAIMDAIWDKGAKIKAK